LRSLADAREQTTRQRATRASAPRRSSCRRLLIVCTQCRRRLPIMVEIISADISLAAYWVGFLSPPTGLVFSCRRLLFSLVAYWIMVENSTADGCIWSYYGCKDNARGTAP